MTHVRGQEADFDEWLRLGCTGWGYDDVLPFYRTAETFDGEDPDGVHGREGPHVVSSFLAVHPLTQAFIDAAMQIGLPFNPDLNGRVREGVAFYQQNRQGRFRAQPAQTYLRIARQRPNLEIRTGALCTRILFEGTRAIGIEYRQGEHTRKIMVRREVILSAGTIRSPQLMQLSGLGDSGLLARLGIPVVVDKPSVGLNLRDHFLVRISHRVKGIASINEHTRGWPLIAEVFKYVFAGNGLLTVGAGTAAAFLRSREGVGQPDAQLLFAPGSFAAPRVLEREPGMTIGAWPSRPESTGSVQAKSVEPGEKPAIVLNYMEAAQDRRVVVDCVRKTRQIFAAPALARWSVRETVPGADVRTDDEVLDFARQHGACAQHFVGTCRMGGDDSSVVDPQLRVRGVRGLRVVDASVMPICTVGNINASVVMVAEKAAAMVRASNDFK
jgi:choline dehydrogenase